MTIARCNFRRRKLNFNAIFLGSSSSERDAEATQAHARTRPHDTFSRFAILASPFLVFASWAKYHVGEFSHGPAWLPRHARSNCCQVRLHQGKFNNHIVLSSMNIVLQLSELRLSTALSPLPPPRKGGLLPNVVYTGVCRWTGHGFRLSP